jgi:uncharacterized protein (TIGR02246 family)
MQSFIHSKYKILLSLILFSAILFGCGQNGTEEDIEAIKAVSSARAEAFNNANAEGIAVHFTEDAVLIPPGEPSRIGRKAVENYYQSIFDEYHAELTSEYKEVDVDGDLAYGRGHAKVKLIPKNAGDTIHSESEYLNILKRQPDGTWKTTHDIWNSSNK